MAASIWTRAAKAKLQVMLEYMKADPTVNHIELDGHSDNSGNRLTNRDLSRRRALAVMEFFKANGIQESQITLRFHGERYPLAPNTSNANRAKNRRVAIRLERGAARGASGAPSDESPPLRQLPDSSGHRRALDTICRFVVISCRATVNYPVWAVDFTAFRRTPWSDGMADVNKVVLAYSGGLDTSVILKWLQDTYNCEVVTFTADLGQGEEVEPARAKAQAMGVKEIYIDDLREEFVRDFVFPMFRANTVYEGEYLLGTSIARPLIAKRLIEIANETGADAISHGATGKGNDQVRFELGAYALKPGVKVIAPWREWDLLSREKLMDYAEKHAIPIERHGKKKSPYSMDANLLHISYEGGVLEDTWTEHEEDMWRWTVSPEKAPDKPQYLELTYRNGDIVALDGVEMTPATVLATLNRIGGEHGIGRLDIVENRYVGMKSRGCYETPGGTIMLRAHRAIESITLDREVAHLKDELMPQVRQPDLHRLLVEP